MITAVRSTHTNYSTEWHLAVAQLAEALRAAAGEDAALDLLKEQAEIHGCWTPELEYIGLRICKPNAPTGQERGA